jgi:hypothetical protein
MIISLVLSIFLFRDYNYDKEPGKLIGGIIFAIAFIVSCIITYTSYINSSNIDPNQQAASEQAYSYILQEFYSKEALIDKLVDDGYKRKVAEAAVNSMTVSWSDMAIRRAEELLENRSYNQSALAYVLEEEGFTSSEASNAASVALLE